MPNSKDVFKWVVKQISLEETADEINSIAYLLLENKFNITRSQIITSHSLAFFSEENLLPIIQRINQGEPIQYILGTQEFYGRSFDVTSAVLIPRPETEQLVATALEFADQLNNKSINLLDIGTGSGCIPITMQLEKNNIIGIGIDNSEEALKVAEANKLKHNSSIHFLLADALVDNLPEGSFDVVLSNPPYITEKEKAKMNTNVLDHEPHSALFVPNDDPLIFYKAIASKSKTQLKPEGLLAVEINEAYGNDVCTLFNQHGFNSVCVLKDISGKDRVVRAIHPG